MPVFVVSLYVSPITVSSVTTASQQLILLYSFLPYTVDFHDLQTPEQLPTQSAQPTDYFGSNAEGQASLFTAAKRSDISSKLSVKTPGATAALEEFFGQSQSSGAHTIHFIKPHDPRTLVRSDAHVSDWGAGILFNHPQSRASDFPPKALLGYRPPGQDEHVLQPGIGIGAPKKKGASPLWGYRKRTPRGSRGASAHFDSLWSSEWSVEPAEQGNGGLSNAVKAAVRENIVGEDVFWVGTLGFPTDSLDDQIKNDISEKLEGDFEAIPLFISDEIFDGHYAHFCKTILWPVLNYQVPDHPKSKAYEDHSYGFYVKLNQAFADKIVASYKRGDTIQIHDYHLLLVPAMVRKKLPEAKIMFFNHTAFPSSEIFRCLATRKELLEGMLGADLIGFQTPEYAQHFLSTCSRLLIVEAMEDGVQLDERCVNVVSNPIGVDPKGFTDAKLLPEVEEWMDVMKERYKGKKLIVARDKLDHIRGVRQKLLAFELFLNKYPEYRENTVLIQVATSTTDNQQLTEIVSEIVNRIDAQHSTLAHQPLVFLRQDIPFTQYLALLSVADVLLITSLRDGMNLTCHEYILCQEAKKSPVILSEFTGSSSVFEGQDLSINPWNYQQTANAIKHALEMPEVEKESRYSKLHEIVLRHTGDKWFKQLSDQLTQYHSEHQSHDTASIPRLNYTSLSGKYKTSKKRVFFLDYDGTLANFTGAKSVHMNNPHRVIETLQSLLLDERNIVYIMSGRTIQELARFFAYLPGIGLIAENGCHIRPFNQDNWIGFPDEEKMEEWKAAVRQILNYYLERVEGSRIEERGCSLLFHYDNVNAAEMDGAERQAGECANHINDACNQHRIHAVPVEKAVLIEPVDWTKASASQYAFDALRNSGQVAPDFLFVAGDDREDEGVFKWANKLGKSGVVDVATTVSLGKRNTEAGATLTQGSSGEYLSEFF
jgi:trehalose-phosphatase